MRAGYSAAMRSISNPWAALLASLAVLSGASVARASERVVQDSMAERVQACVLCHGREGRATPQGYFPRIAGKPAGYLYNQLLNFRDGRRPNATMAGLLRNLSDDYLLEIAQHFAALDLPYAAPAPTPALSATEQARARALVLQGDRARELPACAQCHGERLGGRQPFVPGLLGLPRDYLVAQLGAWQTGQRRAQAPDCMARVARALKPDEVELMARWLAQQPVAGAPEPARESPLPMDCGGMATAPQSAKEGAR